MAFCPTCHIPPQDWPRILSTVIFCNFRTSISLPKASAIPITATSQSKSEGFAYVYA
jgi:hypothetical protein